MRLRNVASCALAALALDASALPELRELEAKWAAEAARDEYAFVWELDIDTIGRGDPYRLYRTIYDGLMYAVTDARQWIQPGTPTAVKLERIERVSGWDIAYRGKISTRETYLSSEPVTLYAEVTRRDCDKDRAQVFFAMSLEPPDAAEWDEMRRMRDRVRCKT